jgi:transcriptional regulator with XRE-family HTH domain
VSERKDRLDEILEELAKRGLVEFPVTDEFVAAFERSIPSEKLSDEDIFTLYRAARIAYQDSVLKEIRKSLRPGTYTLGQYMKLLRERTRLSPTEIAERIGVPVQTLKTLEENTENPTLLPVRLLCNLIEFFSLTTSEFVSAVERFLALLAARGQAAQVQARSAAAPGTRNRGALTSEALDMLLTKAGASTPTPPVDPRLIEEITQELRARGRTDLLK